ncbi:VOC family protein [Streptomyces kanamyceticus]|uniref:VOC family protein n=1 Tax=Streptomyces kanamyceticus TaxID=1967 RepID=A0A5J6GMV8_STRKN|nr:VOC family protein [Streptomyces kanamyceticus]QEU94356.1 VOC family protein [Streptomyces kanamyceticus]
MTKSTAPRTGHIGLNVTDLERSLAFYRDVLGYGVVLGEGKEEGRRFAFLGEEGGRPVLTLWQQADAAYAKGNAGLHHLAIEVDTVERVREYESALRAYGVEFAYEGVVPHGEGATSGGIFFHDPDGTRLEIYAPSGAESRTTPVESAPTCGFF